MSLAFFLLKREDTFGTLSKGMKGIGKGQSKFANRLSLILDL